MRISQITLQEVKDYCGIYEDDAEVNRLIECVAMPAALAFLRGQTGLTAECIDALEDMALAYMAIISEMYTQRDYTVSKSTVNPMVKAIIDMYAVNYVG